MASVVLNKWQEEIMTQKIGFILGADFTSFTRVRLDIYQHTKLLMTDRVFLFPKSI